MLTDAKLRQIKKPEKPIKITDSGGLHLFVTPAGGKLWRWRYKIDGREKLLSLGSYPDITLAQARAARDDARVTLRSGQDPAITKKLAKLTASDRTFEALARFSR